MLQTVTQIQLKAARTLTHDAAWIPFHSAFQWSRITTRCSWHQCYILVTSVYQHNRNSDALQNELEKRSLYIFIPSIVKGNRTETQKHAVFMKAHHVLLLRDTSKLKQVSCLKASCSIDVGWNIYAAKSFMKQLPLFVYKSKSSVLDQSINLYHLISAGLCFAASWHAVNLTNENTIEKRKNLPICDYVHTMACKCSCWPLKVFRTKINVEHRELIQVIQFMWAHYPPPSQLDPFFHYFSAQFNTNDSWDVWRQDFSWVALRVGQVWISLWVNQ